MTGLLIPNQIIRSIVAHGNHWPSGKERGGIILGLRKSKAIQITKVTFPHRWDFGSSTRFVRSERGHRKAALREWTKSSGKVDWVGDWHTHPGGIATPSSIDRNSWRQLVRHTGRPMAFLIFDDTSLYVGMQFSDSWNVRALAVVETADDMTLYR